MHTPRQCPAHSKECYKCHGFHHFAKCCPSGNSQSVRVTQSQRPRSKQVHVLDTPLQSDVSYEESYDQYQSNEMSYHADDEEYIVMVLIPYLVPSKMKLSLTQLFLVSLELR